MWQKVYELIGQAAKQIPAACYGKFYCLRDYALIHAILNDHQAPPAQLVRRMEEMLGKRIHDLLGELRRRRLNTVEMRERWSNQISRMGKHLITLIGSSRTTSTTDIRSLYKELNDFVWKRIEPMNAKAILAVLERHIAPDCRPKQDLRHLLQKSDFSYAQLLVSKILDYIGRECKLFTRNNLQDTIKSTTEFINQTLTAETTTQQDTHDIAEPSAKEQEMERLRQENENFRTALEIAQQQLERLENEIDIIRSEAKTEAKVTFFQQMNSSQFGCLLDQFSCSEERLKEIKRSGYAFPVEVESVPVVIRMFMRFVKYCEVTPLKALGDSFKVNLSQSDQYQYEGSEFLNDAEEKIVQVSTCGWQYSGQIISKPKVVEYQQSLTEKTKTTDNLI